VLIEKELNQRFPGPVEIINAGVYGYSTSQDVDLLKKYGLELKPDLIVILVMTNNMVSNLERVDLTDDGTLRKREGRINTYTKSRQITRFIPGAAWLRQNSHLFKFVGMRLLPVINLRKEITSENGELRKVSQDSKLRDESEEQDHLEKQRPFAVTVALLNDLIGIAKKNGSKSILLTLGGREELTGKESRPKSELVQRDLSTAALQAGFADAIALTQLLREYQGNEPLYFPADGHWTSSATRFLAPRLAQRIASVALQKPKRP
jgi:hypothetical protein